jgi:hypothetical protein
MKGPIPRFFRALAARCLPGTLALPVLLLTSSASAAIVADHTCTDLSAIPESAITAAKADLVIVYGHTSHGSQLTTGMDGLALWKGSLYAWNGTGEDGALHLIDFYGNFNDSGAQDLGNPDFTSWEAATRSYLQTHTSVNVVIWSWCGELSGASESEVDTYLSLMSGLETDFPGVTFVYMTGHLDGTGPEGTLNINNNRIRAYCEANNKVLFDFNDIECYDPDGLVNYMEKYADDACNYQADTGTENWARDWQNSHTENVDWYSCEAAHSEPLNANRKAYAAWWLWARLAGWAGPSSVTDWADAQDVGGWYSSWYGWLYWQESFGNWVYSPTHGWQYGFPGSTAEGLYIWDTSLGCWWWTRRGFYPYVYNFSLSGWFCITGGAAPNRAFWDCQTRQAVSEGDLGPG